jgi:hypothetical protein
MKYDEVGRRAWAPFLSRFGVLANESPADRQIWREAAASNPAA